jgi:serine/threonine-protein kinase
MTADTAHRPRYREEGLLAEGGMATVSQGVADDGTRVVIKRVRAPLCFDTAFQRLFDDEGAVHAALDHPNIVRLLDRGTDELGAFLVFEHVDGTDLGVILDDALARGQPLELPGILAIAIPLFAALHAAHTASLPDGTPLHVVHRDVSPPNVLVGEDGAVKLADFGVATSTLKSEATVAGELKGKFAYMAPEQTRGEKVDARADLFAAGVILWECLANARLFDAVTDADVVHAVRTRVAGSLRELRPDAPVALADLVAALLEKDPELRPRSARDVKSALQDVALELGLEEGLSRHAARLAREAPRRALTSPPVVERRRTQRVLAPATERPARRRTSLWLAAGAVAVVAVVMLVWTRAPWAIPASDVVDAAVVDSVIDAGAPPDTAMTLGPPDTTPPPLARPKAPARPPPVVRPLRAIERVEPPRTPATRFGKLSLSSEPWASVTIDGAPVGQETPLVGLTLPAGHHVVVLRNPVYKLEQTVELDVPADGHLHRFVDLAK